MAVTESSETLWALTSAIASVDASAVELESLLALASASASMDTSCSTSLFGGIGVCVCVCVCVSVSLFVCRRRCSATSACVGGVGGGVGSVFDNVSLCCSRLASDMHDIWGLIAPLAGIATQGSLPARIDSAACSVVPSDGFVYELRKHLERFSFIYASWSVVVNTVAPRARIRAVAVAVAAAEFIFGRCVGRVPVDSRVFLRSCCGPYGVRGPVSRIS